MKDRKLLVIFHIYYHEHVDYYLDKIKNINGCEWDLLVTYVAYSSVTEQKVRAIKPNASFFEVDNVGYDVWPFIRVMQEKDLSGYDYVLKIHTKSVSRNGRDKLNGILVNGTVWRDLLVDALLKSPERFRRCLRKISCNPKCGVLCSYEFIIKVENILPEDTFLLEDEEMRIGIDLSADKFCAGTIFLARVDALKRLKTIEFTRDMWVGELRSGARGTLAHVYERIVCLLVREAGYKVCAISSSTKTTIVAFFNKLFRPLPKLIFSLERVRERHGNVVTCPKYLTVLGLRFKVDDKMIDE